MRLIDADAAIESLTEYGNGRAVYISVEEAVRRIEQLPSAEPDTTTHGSNVVKKGENDGVGTSGDCISRHGAIDYCYQLINVEYQQGSDEMNYGQERVNQTETILHHLEFMPSAQPERKDVFNRDIAIEAICDEVMLWFDISATQAYEIAETAVKRIEVRMEKTEKGEQE